tara:strand:+ start:3547 stop:4863 length:1317 start_codon:yes stop_codon:yes gene_type:complete
MTSSSSSEQKSLRLLTPPLRLSIILAAALSAVGLLWASVAQIPIRTRGTAVFLPASGVRGIFTQTSGRLYLYDFIENQQDWIRLAHSVRNGDDVRFDESKIIFLSKKLLEDIPDDDILADVQQINYFRNEFSVKKGILLARIDNPSLRATLDQNLQDYLITKSSALEVINEYQRQISIYREELIAQQKYLDGMMDLRQKQYASEATVLQQQATISSLKSKISTTNGQIATTRQSITSKYNELFSALSEVLNKSMYFATENLYIDTYLRQTRDFVAQAEQFGIVMNSPPRNPSTIPIFFSNKNAAVVNPGQKALLRLVAQEEQDQTTSTNGLLGEISSMDSYPSSKNTITNLVGSEGVAALISNQYISPTRGSIQLQQDKKGRYLWSSGFMPTELKSQDTFEVEVTTKSVRPISLVLPGLLRILGLNSIPPKPESVNAG